MEFGKLNLQFLAIIFGVSLLMISPIAESKTTSEEVFKAAELYTVKIRTVIENAFSEDEKGSFEGAGFLIDKDKHWILTNAHVVGHSPSIIKASFKGEKYVSAKKVYVDPNMDIAIIQIDTPIPVAATQAPLYCGENLSAGHPVGAFGHPLGLDYTGTRGILSGVTYRYDMEWLQTDASINSGNSGGALISLENGKVLGINTSSDKRGENLNFATSMIYACKIIELLKNNDNPLPPDLAIIFYKNLTEDGLGLVVAENYSDKNKVPLLPNDEILKINDFPKKPTNEIHLIHAARGRLHDTQIKVKRDNKEVDLIVNWESQADPLKRKGLNISGMLVAEQFYKDSNELKADNNLMIHNVAWDSVATSIGFRKYQSIKSVDGKTFKNIKSLYDYLNEQKKDKKHVFKFAVKTISFSLNYLYSYYLYELNAEDVKLTLIGAE